MLYTYIDISKTALPILMKYAISSLLFRGFWGRKIDLAMSQVRENASFRVFQAKLGHPGT